MAERVFVRDLEPAEGNKLLSIIRRGSGSVVRWRRAQIVLWSAQRMSVAAIAEIAFTSPDRVREVIHNFNADGFDSLAPKYSGGRPPTFTLPQRQQIKKIALARPTDHDLPFSTWSLSKLAEFLVAEGVVDDISHEGLRVLLREEGVSFQVIKTWKQSNDPDFETKKNRILELYAIADGTTEAGPDDPTVVICVDEFGPLNLQPHPGKQWATKAAGKGDVEAPRRRRMRATYNRPHGVRHMMGAYDLATDRLYGHVVTTKDRTAFIRFLRYVRKLHPPEVRIAIVLDNFSPHLSTKKDQRVGEWAAANNVELAYTPTYSSWLNRIEAQFQALRYFSLDGTDHGTHAEQASMIRRYIRWRNRHARDEQLRALVKRANVA
ncbi:MAG: IS630 family transposase [Ilumatobacter sp.]|uniref:IS630 family transposase n=1 Tax=Ilumatobacter sp. TaxID=1967498 RepID=UPI00391885FD